MSKKTNVAQVLQAHHSNPDMHAQARELTLCSIQAYKQQQQQCSPTIQDDALEKNTSTSTSNNQRRSDTKPIISGHPYKGVWMKTIRSARRSPDDELGISEVDADALEALLRHYPKIVYMGYVFWRHMVKQVNFHYGNEFRRPSLTNEFRRSVLEANVLGAMSDLRHFCRSPHGGHHTFPVFFLQHRCQLTVENVEQQQNVLKEGRTSTTPGDAELLVQFLKGLLCAGQIDILVTVLVKQMSLDVKSTKWRFLGTSGSLLHLVIYRCADTALLAAVKYLVAAGADLEARNQKSYTALMIAVLEGHLDVVKYLTEAGAGLEAKTADGYTALMCAAFGGHTDTVKYLTEAGADLDARSQQGFTALTLSASEGHLQTVKYLTEAGAGLEVKTAQRATALVLGVQKGHLIVAKYLTEAGAELEAKTQDGYTPLLMASKSGRTDIVKYLVEAGADVEATSQQGFTALMLPAYGGHLQTLKYLTEAGVGLEVKTAQQPHTALLLAAERGHLNAVRYLVEAGAEVEATNRGGYTALMMAALHGHPDIVRYLVDAGAEVEAKTFQGYTALLFATRGGHTNVVKVLMESGANLEAKGPDGGTVLMEAAFGGHADMVKNLTKAGADLDAQLSTLRRQDKVGDRFVIASGCIMFAYIAYTLVVAYRLVAIL